MPYRNFLRAGARLTEEWRAAAAAAGACAGAATAAAAGAVPQLRCEGEAERCSARDAEVQAWRWASDSSGLWERKWNSNWDGRAPPKGSPKPKGGRIRHLLFIRHGQYDLDDEDHGLTELGREQSRRLGERLAQMSGGLFKDRHNEYRVSFAGIWSSDVLRARQTAEILSEYLGPGVPLHPPDHLLAEGQPAVPYPQKSLKDVRVAKLWEDSARIEAAFRHYVYRDVPLLQGPRSGVATSLFFEDLEGEPAATAPQPSPAPHAKQASEPAAPESHVFEVIVGHCNVTRYFVMRALQLPPEAWLRLGGNNTGITELVVRPNGRVSLGCFGDTGHLPVEMVTFH